MTGSRNAFPDRLSFAYPECRTAEINPVTIMTRQLLTFGLFLFVGLAGCQILDGQSGINDGDGDLIWVSQAFSGGQQCGTHDPYDPPDTEKDLEDAGVGVFETVTEMHAVCLACHCPAYSATHFAQIRVSNLDSARNLGYDVSEGPNESG